MSKPFNFKTLVLALSLLSVSGMAQAAFTTRMNAEQVTAEINTQLKAGTSLVDIAKAAKEVGLNPAKVTEFLIKAGQPAVAVVSAVISVTPAAAKSVTSMAVSIMPASQAAEITAAAVAQAPAQAKEITAAAIEKAPAQAKLIVAAVLAVPGVNPGDVTRPSGSGVETARKDSGEDSDRKGTEKNGIVPVAMTPPPTPPASGGGSASPAGI